jgi:hypothetical protein
MKNRAIEMKPCRTAGIALLAWALCAGAAFCAEPADAPKPAAKVVKLEPIKDFTLHYNFDKDGKAQPGPMKERAKWAKSDFHRPGKIHMDKDVLYLGTGDDMTGITWQGPLVKTNYELSLDAMRVEGEDFFCGLTFPVGEDSCSLILGGWGGSIVGLSSIDSEDAANNATTTTIKFVKGQWYHVRVRVYGEKIEAWLDESKIVDVVTTGHQIGIRWEIEPTVPLGIATWRTTGAVRKMEMKALTEKPFDYEVKK